MSQLEAALAHQIEAAKLPTPEREYLFARPRRFRADFAWPKYKILVEVEGGVWTKGRHTRGAGFIKDCEKYNEAALLGWKVIRVPGDWVKSGRALNEIERALREAT